MVLQNWRDSYSSPYTDVRLNGAGTGVSPPYMTCAPVKWLYAAYRRWRAHDREKIRTRPGIEVSLDTRVKALREAGGPTAEALGTRFLVFLPLFLFQCYILLMFFDITTFSLSSFLLFVVTFHSLSFLRHISSSLFSFLLCPSTAPFSLFPLFSYFPFLPFTILQAYVPVKRFVHGTVKAESQELWGLGSTIL